MYIKVRVFSNAKEAKVVQKSDDTYTIYVREKPKLGMANDAVLTLLASALHTHIKKLRIIRGIKSPHKLIEYRTIK